VRGAGRAEIAVTDKVGRGGGSEFGWGGYHRFTISFLAVPLATGCQEVSSCEMDGVGGLGFCQQKV
jgi:hypothetical protein